MCFLPGPPSSPNAFPAGPLRAASALRFSKPQTRLRRSVPSGTVPSEGRGQMKGVSSTRSPLSHGPRPGHVPAAAARARMSQPPPGQAKTSLGSRRRPVLPSRSCSPGAQAAGDTVMGRGTGSCSPRTAATLGPGLSPLNSPPWTCPPQGTILAGLSSSERGVECLLLSGLTPGVEVCTLPHPLLSRGRFWPARLPGGRRLQGLPRRIAVSAAAVCLAS